MADYLVGGGSSIISNEVEIKNDTGNAVPVSDTKSLDAGASDANTLRVIAASDSPEVASIGAVGDAAVIDPTASASVIALLKGLLTVTPAQNTFAAETQLTAAGTTSTVDVSEYSHAIITYTVAAIDTSIDVRPEGSIDDGTTWFNLNPDEADTTITANGTYAFVIPGDAVSALTSLRFNFVSETGGANATVDVQIAASN